MNYRYICILAILALLSITTPLRADKHPNTARGFDIGKPYQMNGIDNVNLFNGNLTVTIPIGQRYHVNGGLEYGLTLVYSGNSWDIVSEVSSTSMTVYPNRRSNAGMGWLVSMGRLFPPNQYPTQESPSWSYETPDGALHAFHAGLHNGPFQCSVNATCYTADGSYLRMTASGSDRTVEFPDGTKHLFREMQRSTSGPWTDTSGTGVWRLREIRDRFANTVTITYDGTVANPEIWTIADGTRTQKVYFIPSASPSYDVLVDRIVLTTFGSTTSEWKMGYAYTAMGRGGSPSRGVTYQPSSFASIPLLTSFTLPAVKNVQQVYSMLDLHEPRAPYYVVNTTPDPLNGVLSGMQLPTKGWLEWDYRGFQFLGSSEEGIQRSIAIITRRMLDAAHANAQTWVYDRRHSDGRICPDPNNPGTGFSDPPEQLVVSVTSPEQVTSIHYFSTRGDAPAPCDAYLPGSTFPFIEYGLPITHGVSQSVAGTTTQYLSEETFSGPVASLQTTPNQYRVNGGNQTRLRSEWAAYEYDNAVNDINSRESVHVTQYEDDTGCTGCYTAVSRFNFDGAGHFRQSSTRSNFAPVTAPAGNFVTSFTNYNQVDPTGPWLLNLFTEQCKVEDSVARPAMPTSPSCGDLAVPVSPGGSILSGPHVEKFCFDGNGFLARHRKLAGSGLDANDLVAVYTQTAGNVTQEDYYGGDAQNTMPTANWCTASLGSPAYSIAHTYSSGSLATSKHLGANSNPDPGFFSVDNAIDANTGLVSISRDAGGLETGFLYDALGRVTTVTPPSGEVPTTILPSEVAAPFKVTAERASASGTIQAITEFDGFGRIAKEQQTLPTTATSRITTYTGSGRINEVSQWENAPVNYTSYTYDPFGRPLTITAPDTSVTTLGYSGIRTISRTIQMGMTRSGTNVSQSPTTTTETYDAQGRLSNLHDAGGNDTGYTYDVSGHLTGVTMGVQTRSFTYDGRGFLTDEQHPELNGAAGKVSYGGFDARGHAASKLLGSTLSDFDVSYKYDAAERLKQIDQVTARTPTLTTRPLKTFTFALSGADKGKLTQDLRHNYRGADDMIVTQDYTYRASDGKLTSRKTTIDKGTTRLQQFTQAYDYTDIGALSTLTYPTCADTFRPCGGSTMASVTPVFSKGMITSIPNFADTISYHDDGTINQIAHPGGITDTYEADDHAMGRPKSIKFESYDSCTPASIFSVTRTPSGTVTPQTTVQLTATAGTSSSAPLTYQWYRVTNNVAVPINGATASVFSEAVSSPTKYRVRIANGCGGSESDIDVPVCAPLSITVQPASQSQAPATLSVAATGCGTLSYQWYQVSGNGNIAVGTNSSSYSTGQLTTQTTFWVKVTDSQGFVNSTNAVVSPSACQPQITQDLPSQMNVDYGTPVSLHITVTGCIGKTYHWFSGPSGNTSTPLWGGLFDGSSTINNVTLEHGPVWVRVDGDSITPVNSATAMISVRPVSTNAVVTPNTTNQITVTWQANAHHYLIRRCANGLCDTPFTWFGGTSYFDSNRTVNTTYLYSIASVDAYGTASAFSNQDLATTMTFTPVVSGAVISRTHINELFTAVNLVRAAYGSPPVTWAGILPSGVPAPPAAGQPTTGIYAAHITSLRTQMDAALSVLGIATPPYTDPTTLTVIKAVHFTDLQDRTR